jgi:hypothetical protein
MTSYHRLLSTLLCAMAAAMLFSSCGTARRLQGKEQVLPTDGPLTVHLSSAALPGTLLTVSLPDAALPRISDPAAVQYTWNFGGGATPATSTEQKPSVRLAASGTYTGTLHLQALHQGQVVTGDYTFTYVVGQQTSPLPLDGPLPVSISGTQRAGQTIVFGLAGGTGLTSLAGLQYAWTFAADDQPATSNEAAPHVELGAAGQKNGSLKLTVTSGGQTFSGSYTFGYQVLDGDNPLPAVDELPVTIAGARYTGSPVTFALDPSAGLSATGLDFLWNFGGGAVPDESPLASPAVVLSQAAGQYTGSLKVTTVAQGITYTGTYSFTYSVSVGPLRIQSISPYVVTEGDTVTLATTLAGQGKDEALSYLWDAEALGTYQPVSLTYS